MKKSRFSEARIVSILKEYEVGKDAKSSAREPGITPATFYKLRTLIDENKKKGEAPVKNCYQRI